MNLLLGGLYYKSSGTAPVLLCFQLVRYFFRDELEIDPEDLAGRRTPLYLAVKSKQPEMVKLLIANGASVKSSCYGKTIDDLIKETLPAIRVVRWALMGLLSACRWQN